MSTSKRKPVMKSSIDTGSLAGHVERFLDWLRVHNYSPHSVVNHGLHLAAFIEWAEVRNVITPQQATKAILDGYQRSLFHGQGRRGKPLAFTSQQGRLVSVRVFFRWLVRQGVLLFNPASEIELPKIPKRLPKDILTPAEAERVLQQPDTNTVFGIRDRAILEVLYSTGMRRAELIKLALTDVDFERAVITIREGKGRKDRVVPCGKRAQRWVRRYLDEARPELALEPDDGVLFLSNLGEAIGPSRLSQFVSEYIKAADIGKGGSVHTWRHSCATSLLEAGMDIRQIQVLLGHQELRSTAIYTQVSIKKLQELHALMHPAEAEDGQVDA